VKRDDIYHYFRDFIKSKDLRYTPEREIIVKEVFANRAHFTIDELYSRTRKTHKKLAKSSIYRTLPLLVKSGLVKEVLYENGEFRYERVYGYEHHDHMKCLGCGKIMEFREKKIERFQDKVCKKYGFLMRDHKLEIRGYCKACGEKMGKLA